MTDLQPSLVVPESSRSSEESFRSVASQSNSAPLSSSKAPSSSNTFASSAVFQHAGLDVYDIDQYLSENANLRATPSRGKAASKGSDQSANGTTEPIALGTETSYFTGALNKKCQSKGFLPVFDIEGKTDFGGVLKLRDVNITSDRRYPTKKKAKEALAEKGLETVNGMEATRKEPGTPQEPRKNWVGMLHEYYTLVSPSIGPVYNYYGLGLAYACTCTIPSQTDMPFGSMTNAFPSKKAAQANAAKEAVEHLIANGALNPDGSTKSRKKVKLGTAVRIQGSGLEVKKESSYAQKVNDICPLLGLHPPHYVLAPASDQAQHMLSGYATFANGSGMPAQIGEVRHVFGKKNAKEEIAKGVWEVLQELAAKRNVRVAVKEGMDVDGEGPGGSDGRLV